MSLLSLGADMNISEKILVVFCAGIGVPFLGFVCGRFFSAWFPFRLTKKFYLPIKIKRTFISAGDTPLIREACPIVLGCIFDNF